MKGYTLSNIKAYLVGNLRLKCYDNSCSMFIRKHILEQIAWRIKVMEPACYNNGSCEICGCETPALQMSNKGCDKPCYPTMMNKVDWEMFSRGSLFYDRSTLRFWQNRKSGLINFNKDNYVEQAK